MACSGDREGGDCKGNSYNPAYQGLVTRVWGKHALANIQIFFKGESSRYKALFTLHDIQATRQAVQTTQLYPVLRSRLRAVAAARSLLASKVLTPPSGIRDSPRFGGGRVADAA